LGSGYTTKYNSFEKVPKLQGSAVKAFTNFVPEASLFELDWHFARIDQDITLHMTTT
jgi:hypothetical protein